MKEQEYMVFFEVYGKKLKTKVLAYDEHKAIEIVKSSINVIKVIKEPYPEPKEPRKVDDFDGVDNFFEDLLDLFTKKK